MGNEAVCKVTLDGTTAEAKALLETAEIVVRAPFRIKVPFAEMKQVEADERALRVQWSSHELSIELGADATKWERKIRNPRSVTEKLGIRSGQRISIAGKVDAAFISELEAQGAHVSTRVGKESDLIFFGVDSATDLAHLDVLRKSLGPDGGIWIVRPKGTKAISDADVLAAGRGAGLVDVKVVSVSALLTAEKLVIPRTKR